MATLNAQSLGQVQSETQTKDSGLLQFPMPGQNSNDAFLLDLFGVIRTIAVEGIFTGTLAQQNTFITAIEGIENGAQSPVSFVSSQTSTANKNVLIQNFSWTVSKANPGYVSYSLTLIEGTS
jgi:hypothetical protein